MESIKAVLFDFDGTLADTMDDNFACWHQAVLEQGVEITAAQYFPLEGLNVRQVAATLLGERAASTDLAEVVAKKDSLFCARHKFKAYPGVTELIATLNRCGIKCAIVTAAQLPRIKSTVPAAFLDQFNGLITSESAGRGKPNPDPYLNGAKLLNVDPNECIVVENAPLGVQAAKAAGMRCIAVTTTLSASYLSEADEIIQQFSDLCSTKILAPAIGEQPANAAKH